MVIGATNRRGAGATPFPPSAEGETRLFLRRVQSARRGPIMISLPAGNSSSKSSGQSSPPETSDFSNNDFFGFTAGTAAEDGSVGMEQPENVDAQWQRFVRITCLSGAHRQLLTYSSLAKTLAGTLPTWTSAWKRCAGSLDSSPPPLPMEREWVIYWYSFSNPRT